MRSVYPLPSAELNDKLLMSYSHLVYLLGNDADDQRYSGLYEHLETSGNAFMTNASGIPHVGNYEDGYKIGIDRTNTSDQVIFYAKWDYILRKLRGVIKRVR